MRDKLMRLARQVPLDPCMIELSNGRQISVRSSDRIFMGSEKGSLVVVQDDHGLFDLLPVLHITTLTSKEPAPDA